MPSKHKKTPLISERDKALHAFSSVSAAQTYLYLQTSISGHDPWPNLIWHLSSHEKDHIAQHSARRKTFLRSLSHDQNTSGFQENKEGIEFGEFMNTGVLEYLQQQAMKAIQKDNMLLEKMPFQMLFNQPQSMMNVLKNQHEHSDFLPRLLEIIIEDQWHLHPDASVQSFLDRLNSMVLEQHQDIWGALNRIDAMEIHDATHAYAQNNEVFATTQRDIGLYHMMLTIQAERNKPFPLHENLFFDFSQVYEQNHEHWLNVHHMLYNFNSSSSKVLKSTYTFTEQDVQNYKNLEADAFKSQFSNQYLGIKTSFSLYYAFQIYAKGLNTRPDSSVSQQFKHSMVHAYHLQAGSTGYNEVPFYVHQEIIKILADGNQKQSEFHLYCLSLAINSLSFEPPYTSKELLNVSLETLYDENNRLPFLQKLITCLPKPNPYALPLLDFIFDSEHPNSPMFSKNSENIQIRDRILEAQILSGVKNTPHSEKPGVTPLLSSRF